MSNITASLVKQLREITQAGMMECKKALVETNGNLDEAIELLRKKGAAKADKKSGRTAAEGLVAAIKTEDSKQAILLEINSETDFVAKEPKFVDFLNQVAKIALENKLNSVEDLSNISFDGSISIDEKRKELISTIGENISIRRVQFIDAKDGVLSAYVHGGGTGSRIASIVSVSISDSQLAYDIAMHVAAMKPEYIDASCVPEARKEKEKEILLAQAEEQHKGKPADILEKIISGKMNKFIQELTLVGQSFVKDPDMTIEKLLKSKDAKVTNMLRYEVGEGIEKEITNFAEEVMSQVRT